jgi:hypothetical protein
MFRFIIIIILIIFFLGFLFGFSVLRTFFRAIFGSAPKPRSTSSNQQKKKQTNKQQNTSNVKKIFTREEGEYVDFEEIKD